MLLGDAAGYLDAVTGEGLSLGFGCATRPGRTAPRSARPGRERGRLAGYEAAWRRRYRVYLAWTRLVLWLSRHPAVRRGALKLAAAHPAQFERMVAAAVG